MAWSCFRYKRKRTTLRRYRRKIAIFFTVLLCDQHIAFQVLSAPHFAIVSSVRSCWILKSRFMLFPIPYFFCQEDHVLYSVCFAFANSSTESTVTESNHHQWFCRPPPRLTVRCIWPQPDLNRASATWKAAIITFRLWGRSAYDRIWTCGIRVKSPLPYRLATYANIVSIYNVYTGTRTQNLTVKSRLLCQLSYIHKKPFIHRGQTVLN